MPLLTPATSVHKNQLDIDFKNSDPYPEYFRTFYLYIHSNSHKLDDLWLVVGATNMNIESQGRMRNDLERFHMYDIAINNDEEVDIDKGNHHLVSLSLKALKREPSNLFLYTMLALKLPNKFSRILFDWSVQKFIPLQEFAQLLKNFKTMLKVGGELYMEHDPYHAMEFMIPFRKGENGQYFLYQDKSRLTGEQAAELFSSSDVSYRAILEVAGKIIKIYNVKALFPQLESGVSLQDLMLHAHLPEHKKTEATEKAQPLVELLDKVFLAKDGFTHSLVFGRVYPNNPDSPDKVITTYLLVTRNVVTGGAKRRHKRKTNRKRRRKLSRKR